METMEQLRQEVANVRGDLELLQKGVHDAGLADRGFQEDTVARLAAAESRVAALETTLGVAASPAAPATRPGGDAPAAPAPAKDPEAVVDAIEKALADDKPAVARTLARAFLSEHPKHARAAEVQYRLAESHDNEKDYKVAAAAYQVVVDAYPTSTWAGWALLRQGECFDSLKRPDDAVFFYEDVVKRFPKHKAAKEAKAKLQARKR
jgi:tol-pal system protein YbgF